MDEHINEKKAGFFGKLIDAGRGILAGGSKKKSDSTAVANVNAKDLSRIDLLEMLVELGRENARLKAEIEDQGREIEKKELLLQAARKAAPVLTTVEEVNLGPSSVPNAAAVHKAEQMAAEAEARAIDAEKKAAEAASRIKEAEQRIKDAELKAKEAQDKIDAAEKKARRAAEMVEAAELRAREAEEKAANAERQIQEADSAGSIATEVPEELTETVAEPESSQESIEEAAKTDAYEEAAKTDAYEEAAKIDAYEEDIDDLYAAPVPGSLEAIIAASAAAAVLRSRAFSDEALAEEGSLPKAEPVRPRPQTPPKSESSCSQKQRAGRSCRAKNRVPMREAARRAGISKD